MTSLPGTPEPGPSPSDSLNPLGLPPDAATSDVDRDDTPVSPRTMNRMAQLSDDARLARTYPKRRGGGLETFMGAVMTGLGVAAMATGVGVPAGAVLTFIGACFLLDGGRDVVSKLSATSMFSRRRARDEARAQPDGDVTSQLTGLNNSGVDCYQNATLQFLRELEPEFRELFAQPIHGNPSLAPGCRHGGPPEPQQRERIC